MTIQIGAPASVARDHEELFAYWAKLRRQGALPGRQDIDPGGFKRLLPTISLIDVRPGNPRDYRVRLAGTNLYTVYGREITGKPLSEVYNSAAEAYWRHELDQVVEKRRPSVGRHSLSWRGAAHLSIVWLRLPLARDGRTVDMILGYDAVVGLQNEAGATGIRAA